LEKDPPKNLHPVSGASNGHSVCYFACNRTGSSGHYFCSMGHWYDGGNLSQTLLSKHSPQEYQMSKKTSCFSAGAF
jgi:hypothetical protein